MGFGGGRVLKSKISAQVPFSALKRCNCKILPLDINILVCFYLKHCTILLLWWWDFASNTRMRTVSEAFHWV